MAQTKEERLLVKKQYRENNQHVIQAQREKYRKSHNGRSIRLLANCRRRAKLSGGKMELTYDWIFSKLEKGVCEVTKLEFSYERDNKYTRSAFAPSIDRINPEDPNYTLENCRLVLWAVNCTMAEYGEEIMLPILRAILNAKQNKPTPVPEKYSAKSQTDSESRSIPRTGSGQDCDGSHHHRGESEG